MPPRRASAATPHPRHYRGMSREAEAEDGNHLPRGNCSGEIEFLDETELVEVVEQSRRLPYDGDTRCTPRSLPVSFLRSHIASLRSLSLPRTATTRRPLIGRKRLSYRNHLALPSRFICIRRIAMITRAPAFSGLSPLSSKTIAVTRNIVLCSSAPRLISLVSHMFSHKVTRASGGICAICARYVTTVWCAVARMHEPSSLPSCVHIE